MRSSSGARGRRRDLEDLPPGESSRILIAVCAGALLLLAGPARAQPAFERLERRVDPIGAVERVVLEVRADRSVTLVVRAQPPGTATGLASPLTSRLTDAEAQALDAALRAPALRGVPGVVPNDPAQPRTPDTRFELEVDRPGAQPDLRVAGALHHHGPWAAGLDPVMAALDAIERRVRALDTRVYLEIADTPGLPASMRADEDLLLVLEGPGRPGVELDHLEVVLQPRRVQINAVGRSVGTAPARPFRETLRLTRPAGAGIDELVVVLNTRRHDTTGHAASERIDVYDRAAPPDGVYRGRVEADDGQVWLRVHETREHHPRLRVRASRATLDVLAAVAGERVRFRGRPGAAGEVVLDALLSPERRTIAGQVLASNERRTVQLDDGAWVYTLGPAARALPRASGRRVELDVWYVDEPGVSKLPRAYVLRIAATAREDARLRRGLRGVGRVARGDRVWVTGTKLFGRRLVVEPATGGPTGTLCPRALALGEPLPAAPAPGIAGSVPGAP